MAAALDSVGHLAGGRQVAHTDERFGSGPKDGLAAVTFPDVLKEFRDLLRPPRGRAPVREVLGAPQPIVGAQGRGEPKGRLRVLGGDAADQVSERPARTDRRRS